MSDDKTKRGGQDPQRVNLHQPWEVRTWTKKFNCTTEELKNAVKSVLAEGYEPTVVRVGDRLKWFKRFDAKGAKAKTKKPAAKKPAAKKPAAKKPAAKKPAAKKPAAKKPAAKKPA